MPCIDLLEIKKHLVRSNDLFQMSPNKLGDNLMRLVNCYAYALGILYPRDIFNPGFSQNLKYYGKGPEEIVTKINIDLKTLGMKFKHFSLSDKIILEKNEYLIKAFFSAPSKKSPLGDFHFIRQDKQSRLWFHKWKNQQPELIHPYLVPEFGPQIINVMSNNFLLQYKAIGFWAITEGA